MKRVVIYARYSSEKQNEKSIEDQIKACKEFAQQNNFNVVNTYIDRAKSGKSDNRPSFQKMIEDSKKNKFDLVLCWKYDRISRNTRDYYYYEKILYDNGVSVVSINEMVDDPQAAPIIKAVNLGMAESYNVTLAINVNRGMRSNARQCKSNGPLPLGYVADKNRVISVDPETAPYVKDAFEAVIAGASYADIARYFNGCGLTSRFGSPWNGDTIKRLLQNDRYAGTYRYADIVIEDGMPQIIDKPTFYKVQEIIKGYRRKKNMDNVESYLLIGKLRCSDCNKVMKIRTGTSKSGKIYRYYYCGCQSVRKDYIDPLVIELTKKYILTDEVIEKIADYAMDLQAECKKNSKENALKLKLKEVNRKIDNICDVLMDGTNSPELKNRLERLEDEKKNLLIQIEIEEAFNEDVTRDSVVWYFKQFQDELTPELEQELVDKLIMYVYLDEETIWIQYKFAEKEKNTQVLRLKELECSSNHLYKELQCSSNHRMVNHCRVRLNTYKGFIILKVSRNAYVLNF